jgi:glycosyltransferase involved in cell wall biosynthesis
MNNPVLIYDPVPFKGGSKKVIKTIIGQLPSDMEVWVLSNDGQSWSEEASDNVHVITLFSPQCLQNKTTGFLFFLKHVVYLFSLIVTLILGLIKTKKIIKIIGLSGPSVDFSLYLLNSMINIDIIQFIQGNIAPSKVAGFGLTKAKRVFYLPSTHDSMVQAIKCYRGNDFQKCNKKLEENKFTPFINGIDFSTIKVKEPSKANDKTSTNVTNNVSFLWAASLLRWKRIDLFIDAISELNSRYGNSHEYVANVCYIQPQTDAYLDAEQLAQFKQTNNIQWYRDPRDLNDIRSRSSVFISTSEHEPFGLSILEAMAAGLAIVIPADNAYWDQHLTDGVDCIKFIPNNSESLTKALTRLVDEPEFLLQIAEQAQCTAQQYDHISCYSFILKSLLN